VRLCHDGGVRLQIGFDERVPEAMARTEALAEWERVTGERGLTLVEPDLRVDYDDPERTILGEYVVVMSDGNESRSP
jgi:hypothetical protein